MKESLPKIDSSCNDTFRRISKVPTMPVLSRFTYTAYVLADSLFFSSTPGASSSRGRLQVGGVCKSGASARASSRRERLQVGNAFKSGASLRRHEQFNAACLQCCIFHSNGKKKYFLKSSSKRTVKRGREISYTKEEPFCPLRLNACLFKNTARPTRPPERTCCAHFSTEGSPGASQKGEAGQK